MVLLSLFILDRVEFLLIRKVDLFAFKYHLVSILEILEGDLFKDIRGFVVVLEQEVEHLLLFLFCLLHVVVFVAENLVELTLERALFAWGLVLAAVGVAG